MVLRDIVKIEGERNYSIFHLSKGKVKTSAKTLGYFEERVAGYDFFRCHRSFMVNRHYIDRFEQTAFILKDGDEVPVSRRRKIESRTWFLT